MLLRQIGISSVSYNRYERGEREPDHDTLSKLATFFNVSTNYLLGLTNIPDKIDDYAAKQQQNVASPQHHAADNLTEDEREMLEKFRQLPDKEKGRIEGRIDAAYEQMTEDTHHNEVKGA